MTRDELIQYIVDQLSKGNKPSDIVYALCERHGMFWADAEALVKTVSTTHESHIARKQMPLMFGIALITFLGGLALCGYSFNSLITILQAPGDKILLLLLNSIQTNFLLGPLSTLIYGIAMVLGSLLGMRDTWTAILSGGKEPL
jgi:hypothetical protein